MERFWKEPGRLIGRLTERSLEGIWKETERILEGVWKANWKEPERKLEGIWKTPGRLIGRNLEDTWKEAGKKILNGGYSHGWHIFPLHSGQPLPL